MDSRYILLFLAATIPGVALAQGSEVYQCSFGELQRRVEILHETEMSVPCEVHYYKDTEAPGERQVLWSASSEAGYCDKKAEEFVAKLEDWGWDCGQDDVQKPDDPEPVDDTESLTSAEEPEPKDQE